MNSCLDFCHLQNFTFLHYVQLLRIIATILLVDSSKRLSIRSIIPIHFSRKHVCRTTNHFHKLPNLTSKLFSIILDYHRDIKCRRASGFRWIKSYLGRRKEKRAKSERIGDSEFVVGWDIPCLWCLIKNDRSSGNHHLVRDGRLSSTGLRRRILRSAYRFIRAISPPLKGLKLTTPFWPPFLSYIANHRTRGHPFAHTTGKPLKDPFSRSEIKKLTWVRGRRRWRLSASSGCFRSSITGGSNLMSIFRD